MLLNPISNLLSPWEELELDGVELINALGGPLVACWVEPPVASGHQERFANLNSPGRIDGKGQGLPALPCPGGNVKQLDVLLGIAASDQNGVLGLPVLIVGQPAAGLEPFDAALIGLPSELLVWC